MRRHLLLSLFFLVGCSGSDDGGSAGDDSGPLCCTDDSTPGLDGTTDETSSDGAPPSDSMMTSDTPAGDTSTPSCGDIESALPAWTKVAPEKEIYVSPTGNDANDGSSPSKALKTTSAAFAKLAPGVRLNFATGTYACGMVSNFAGTATKPGFIRSSDGPRKAKLDCATGASVMFDNIHYVMLDGFEIANATGHGVQLSSGSGGPWDITKVSNDLVLHQNYIHDTSLASFKGSQARAVYIIGNELAYANPGRQNVEFVAVDDIVVAGNEAHHSGAFDEFKGGAINGQIYRNYIHDPVNSGGNQTGILVGGDGTGTAYLVHTTADAEATNLKVWGNVIVDGDHAGFRIVSCKNCVVANNTFYHSGKPNAYVRVLSSQFQPGGAVTHNQNVLFANNVIYSKNPTGYAIPSNEMPSVITFKNNAWFAQTGDVTKIGSDIPFTGEPASIYADPQLVSPPTDLHPKSGSPVIGKGMTIADAPANRDGMCWKGAPNIGAY